MLSVNSLEVHGLIHQINGSVQSEQKLAVNIEAHSKFMKENDANANMTPTGDQITSGGNMEVDEVLRVLRAYKAIALD